MCYPGRQLADSSAWTSEGRSDVASVRKRGKTFMGLYRDSIGSQRSAGTYPTEKQALKAARLSEAGYPHVKDQNVFAEKVRGTPHPARKWRTCSARATATTGPKRQRVMALSVKSHGTIRSVRGTRACPL